MAADRKLEWLGAMRRLAALWRCVLEMVNSPHLNGYERI